MSDTPDAPLDARLRTVATARHRTAFLEAGPPGGPLMILMHGWPELGLLWRHQLAHFAASGWHVVAPDMRGYGGSGVPDRIDAYAVPEIVADMVELHDALGGAPAIWVGRDWGSPVLWGIASHHRARCRGVVSMCVPYLARGFTLATLVPLVDRAIYPADAFPVGQWDYWLHYREDFAAAARCFEADIAATMAALFRSGSRRAQGKPTITADVRARGGWFDGAGRAPDAPRHAHLMPDADFAVLVAAFAATGLRGANAWYCNDVPNAAYAAAAPDFGRLTLPVLFLHAALDTVCQTVTGRLAEPMRADCTDLTEATIEAGHHLMLEKPAEVNAAIDGWLAAKSLA
ncbi:alpha/beta fold hydrolase [Acuticoccus sp. I52.16.1]|uniref:alpha/beta fold hydrolase n=1 Tax=Acuticoccus sp. I52.16.1 TaxID=2928472 RepID=UPI001FD12A3A|nr:alpha/beta fold hydrolase [Acuticoccus sp. I52.16.1]UOM34034.1 alpha/beta hydrolase [Acuticoccus sp. I52.16.1]